MFYLKKLQFPPEQEQAFKQDYVEKSLSMSRIALALGLGMVAVFAFLDYWALPSSYQAAWALRFGIMFAPMLTALLLSFSRKIEPYLQNVLALAMFFPGIGIVLIITLANLNDFAYSTYYAGILLVSFAGYTFVQLRFRYALTVGILLLLAYEGIALFYQDILTAPNGALTFVNNNFFFITGNIIGIFACYAMELFARRDFMQRSWLAQRTTELEIQKQEIEALREQDRQYFEQISQIKDEFMRMASHDLKNPLSIVKTSVWLLERHGALYDDKGKFYLNQIQRSADRMQMLITDLLDLARLETGLALEKKEICLSDLLGRVITNFTLPAQDKQIDLRYLPLNSESGEIMAEVDTNRLEQALNNLLSNAIKYTPAGGSVRVGGSAMGSCIMIRISDTGLGIPAEDIPHLFDKFYRVEKPEHLEIEGTGLGLSIVKTIIEQHGGRILVESQLGQGSTFTIILPNARVRQTQEQPAIAVA